LTISLIALIAFVLLGATTIGGMMGGSMMGPGMMWGYSSQSAGTPVGGWPPAMAMGIGWLMMLAFWGALILGAILLVRRLTSGAESAGAPEHPLRILQRRYVSGDIEEATYLRMKREIEPGSSAVDAEKIRRAS
jgi:putative membrane protein